MIRQLREPIVRRRPAISVNSVIALRNVLQSLVARLRHRGDGNPEKGCA